ncbi:MAG TPA: spore germination protein GerPB [Bacilli bacterium]|nr:spore germination protein GerPB [Bacilli bacterium]
MRVTQTISIGSLKVNSMSNSSILQIGASGAIKARSEDIKEIIPQSQADQTMEGIVTKEVKPILEKEGLPVEPPGGAKAAKAGQPPPPAGASTGLEGVPTAPPAPPKTGEATAEEEGVPSGAGNIKVEGEEAPEF